MNPTSKNIQLQYQGFYHTPILWKEHKVFDLLQLELPYIPCVQLSDVVTANSRLGKRVEQFVSSSLKQHKNISILAENIQIQHHKITVGELDCILSLDKQPIHLEIVYKFYLYDDTVGTTELEHWIGPNRNDNLLKKLHKLRDKQLPLLFNTHSKECLNDLDLNTEDILQRVYFKAQLFIPHKAIVDFSVLNRDCVQGFYIPFTELQQFSLCKFYIPSKMDWLLEAHTQVSWVSFDIFKEHIQPLISEKRAPLSWIKFPNGSIKKMFVVWW